MPRYFVDLTTEEMEYDGGFNWKKFKKVCGIVQNVCSAGGVVLIGVGFAINSPAAMPLFATGAGLVAAGLIIGAIGRAL